MQDHAGIVIGGTTLVIGPHTERARSAESVGISSANRSNKSCGVPQSSPTSTKRMGFPPGSFPGYCKYLHLRPAIALVTKVRLEEIAPAFDHPRALRLQS